MAVIEREVTCPSCWESHTLLIDLTDSGRSFVEDCQVCCHPMQVEFEVAGGELVALEVETT